MFFHIFTYRIRIILKNKSILFWTLIFPLVMSGLFFIAFNKLEETQNLEAISVGIIENNSPNESISAFSQTLKETTYQKKKLFKVNFFKSKKQAQTALMNNKITGYFTTNKNTESLQLTINEKGTSQNILTNFFNQFEQGQQLLQKMGPEDFQATIQSWTNQPSLLATRNQGKEVKMVTFYFFTLIGMTIMYSYMFGLLNAHDQQANQSEKGIRLSLTPRNKLLISSANLLAAFTIFYGELLILLGIFQFIYQIDFGNRWGEILLLSALGSLSAISFGQLIGNLLSKWSFNQKVGLGIGLSMLMSMTAGMMGTEQLKYWIDTHLPLIGKLNLVNLMSDSLLQLLRQTNPIFFYQNLIYLLGWLIITILLNFFIERRVQYDHL